jgi:hypothetical protein
VSSADPTAEVARQAAAAVASPARGDDHATRQPRGAVARERVAALVARRPRHRAPHLPVSPSVLNEELAAALLYGNRSGSVSASPARPPG